VFYEDKLKVANCFLFMVFCFRVGVAAIKRLTLDYLLTEMAVLGASGSQELCKGTTCKYLDLSSS
jgi:hypothetical protein